MATSARFTSPARTSTLYSGPIDGTAVAYWSCDDNGWRGISAASSAATIALKATGSFPLQAETALSAGSGCAVATGGNEAMRFTLQSEQTLNPGRYFSRQTGQNMVLILTREWGQYQKARARAEKAAARRTRRFTIAELSTRASRPSRDARSPARRRCRRPDTARRCRASDCVAAIRRAASPKSARPTRQWDAQAPPRRHSR